MENVPVTRRFSYFPISETALSPPKSIYASSTTTMREGSAATSRSISERERSNPVGAFGFAIKSVPLASRSASIGMEKSERSGITVYGNALIAANTL